MPAFFRLSRGVVPGVAAMGCCAIVLLAACGGGGGDGPTPPAPPQPPGPPTPPAPTVASVTLQRSGSWLVIGDTVRFTAVARDAQGATVSGAATPVFGASGDAVTVTAGGDVVGVKVGTATVTARVGTLEGTATVQVVAGSGARATELHMVDSAMINEMRRLRIPGAQIAIARAGRLLFARGYGWADTTTRRPVTLDAMFRVGSTSKPLTAVATMRLVQEGKLSLDTKVFERLTNVPSIAGRTEDPRTVQLTVRDLLAHLQGYDSTRVVDDTSWAVVNRGIVDPVQLARYGRSARFTTNPGVRHAYNNYGYILLGRLIERASGQTYEQYVKSAILAPAGVTAMHLGRSPLASRHPLEVTCYDTSPTLTGLYGTGKDCDVRPYQEYAEASGAWVASATDMARWISVVDGVSGGPADVLTASTIATMTAQQVPGPNLTFHYALGWQMVADGPGWQWQHSGGQTGGDGWVARRADGTIIVIVANLTRGQGTGGASLDAVMMPLLRTITTWPAGVPF